MHASKRSRPPVAIGLPLGLVLVLLGACSAPSSLGQPQSERRAQTSGRSVHRLQVAGVSRQYELFLPPHAADTQGYPVVFAFHGAGSTIASLARASGIDAKAAQAGVAVVYPQGLGARFDTGAGSRDVQFVAAVINDLDARIGINRTRLHATGFSNGAFLCYRLASDLPGVFASIAPVAGLLARSALPARGVRTSLLHVHGSADRVVSPTGRGGSYGAQEGAAAWARQAGCAATATNTLRTDAAPLRVRRRRFACAQGVQVSVLWLEGVGHTWPQEAGGWLSREIWTFFGLQAR